MSKMHWNSVYLNKELPSKMIIELINDSYELVLKSLAKKLQIEISELENFRIRKLNIDKK
jgi:predicted DNA-binding protein (MmcQ/YjbR family)